MPPARAGRSVLELVNAGVGFLPLLAERCRGLLVNSEVARRLVQLDLAPLAHHPPIHVLPPACPPVSPNAGSLASASSADDEAVVVAFGVVSMAKRPDLLIDAAALAGCRVAFVGPCPPILAQVIGDRARARGITDRVTVTGAVDDAGWQEWLDRATLAVQLRDSASGETSAAVLEALAAGVPVVTNLATATEYGEGTVSHLPAVDAPVVAERLRRLLDHPEDRHRLAEAGMAFARAHQFDRLADALLSIVTASGDTIDEAGSRRPPLRRRDRRRHRALAPDAVRAPGRHEAVATWRSSPPAPPRRRRGRTNSHRVIPSSAVSPSTATARCRVGTRATPS